MKKPILICIAGGTASGKTTVVNKIIAGLNEKDICLINHDDYYKDLSHLSMAERERVNYDHPSSLDNDLFYDDLKALLNGEDIYHPVYNFSTHSREKERVLTKAKPIIITEGILVLEDERIRDLADIKIYVESDDDIRFIRRLLRDTKERGRTTESVIKQYLETVKPMHYSFVKPTKRYADIIVPNDKEHDVAVQCIIGMINNLLKKED